MVRASVGSGVIFGGGDPAGVHPLIVNQEPGDTPWAVVVVAVTCPVPED